VIVIYRNGNCITGNSALYTLSDLENDRLPVSCVLVTFFITFAACTDLRYSLLSSVGAKIDAIIGRYKNFIF